MKPFADQMQEFASLMTKTMDPKEWPKNPMLDLWQQSLKTFQLGAPHTDFTQPLQQLHATLDPDLLSSLQQEYMSEWRQLWQKAVSGQPIELIDKRFSSDEWKKNSAYAFNAAIYLLNARFLMRMAEAVQAAPAVKRKLQFAVQQMMDAMAPSNFFATNPDAQHQLMITNGESLCKGITNILTDLQKGHISQTDESAFEVGKNVANTEGSVVFENTLFQLIQYKPLTKTVYEIPLLIVPPCVNKYYILDLQPENSLVRYALEQGQQVFLMSWRNPDQTLGHLTWEDYIEQGAITAIHTVQQICEQDKIHALGFCIGGTILSTALAVLSARKEQAIASLTLLTTLLDFENPGALEVFVDEAQLQMREQTIGRNGLMMGHDLAAAFSSLRPNELVWNYVVGNYLKGEQPPPFDLLYWNSDNTNLPGPMYCWFLRNAYLENNLKTPKKVIVAGEKIDFGSINAPVFMYASREDHLVPWQASFQSMQLLNRKKPLNNHFVLGASGHIAGVINSPAKKKRCHWRMPIDSANKKMILDAEDWFAAAQEMPGSWWPSWIEFLNQYGGKKVEAPLKLGGVQFSVIEDAPGRYVKIG